jgi:hypothetical protein
MYLVQAKRKSFEMKYLQKYTNPAEGQILAILQGG